MSFKPVERNYTMYKGADFYIYFRLRDAESATINPTTWGIRFTASDQAGGTRYFDVSNGDSPLGIAVNEDEDYRIELRIPGVDTAGVDVVELYYEIDTTDDDGNIDRRMVGNIIVKESA